MLLGIVNAIVRPIAVVLTLPLTLLTLGLFLLVVNAAMLGLVALLLSGFQISGFWTAVGGSLIVSVTGWLASGLIGNSGKVEVMTAAVNRPCTRAAHPRSPSDTAARRARRTRSRPPIRRSGGSLAAP